MAHINYVDPIEGTKSDLDFSDLVTLIKGSSISSLAIADDFFELGLTDAFNLRIYGQIGVELISTLNKGELPPVPLRILSDKEDATARPLKSISTLCANSMLLPS